MLIAVPRNVAGWAASSWSPENLMRGARGRLADLDIAYRQTRRQMDLIGNTWASA
jgi:hypothetical protein